MQQNIVITGANTGIGLATAQRLAAEGHQLILACRNLDKANSAANTIEATGVARPHIVNLDLADLSSIQQSVNDINDIFPQVDVLINNAGLFNNDFHQTAQGYESHYGVNVLGSILLTELLLPSLAKAPQARIVHVASVAHLAGKIEPSSYRTPKKYRRIAAYGQSKLGNLLYSNALAVRLQGSNISSNALHPGAVDSDIYRTLPKWQKVFINLVLIPPAVPAKLMTEMATGTTWQGKTGQYVAIQAPQYTAKCSRDAAFCQDFMNAALSELQPYLTTTKG